MDPILDKNIRKKLILMSDYIFDKIFINKDNFNEKNLTEEEKIKVDRSVLKYLETSKYIMNTFESSIQYISSLNQK